MAKIKYPLHEAKRVKHVFVMGGNIRVCLKTSETSLLRIELTPAQLAEIIGGVSKERGERCFKDVYVLADRRAVAVKDWAGYRKSLIALAPEGEEAPANA